jgi:cell division protein FtsN
MGWIDEETRMRWDSREARQPQIALVEKVLPPNPELLSPKEEEVLIEPEVAFTFYEELPKAVIQLTAQPLPVRTRAPTYLQLSSFANAKDAEEERSRLAQKGYLSQVSTQLNHQGRPNYLLRMGPYEDQRVINRLKVELQRLGLDAKEVTMTSVIKAQEKTQEKMQEKLQEQRSQEKNADKANTGR